jgi:predicted RNA binding protein YcfA (HicA-like mRNA interferase family)
MKIPRDVYGAELVKKLRKFDYEVHHQTGSHIIIRTYRNGENTQSVPNHKPLKIGTLNGILGDIAEHLSIDKKDLVQILWGK